MAISYIFIVRMGDMFSLDTFLEWLDEVEEQHEFFLYRILVHEQQRVDKYRRWKNIKKFNWQLKEKE